MIDPVEGIGGSAAENAGAEKKRIVCGTDFSASATEAADIAAEMARHLNVKTVAPVAPEKATKLTGYLIGGTSPFGVKTKMPVYAEKTIFDLPQIYINGGKRGFLIAIEPRVLKEVLRVEEIEAAVKE